MAIIFDYPRLGTIRNEDLIVFTAPEGLQKAGADRDVFLIPYSSLRTKIEEEIKADDFFAGGDIEFGDLLPTSPKNKDIYIFNNTASGLSNYTDTDGSTPLTSAVAGDVAQYNGSVWVKRGSINFSSGGGVVGGDTAAQIVAKLESLRGGDRLDASAIQNLPSGGGTGADYNADEADTDKALKVAVEETTPPMSGAPMNSPSNMTFTFFRPEYANFTGSDRSRDNSNLLAVYYYPTTYTSVPSYTNRYRVAISRTLSKSQTPISMEVDGTDYDLSYSGSSAVNTVLSYSFLTPVITTVGDRVSATDITKAINLNMVNNDQITMTSAARTPLFSGGFISFDTTSNRWQYDRGLNDLVPTHIIINGHSFPATRVSAQSSIWQTATLGGSDALFRWSSLTTTYGINVRFSSGTYVNNTQSKLFPDQRTLIAGAADVTFLNLGVNFTYSVLGGSGSTTGTPNVLVGTIGFVGASNQYEFRFRTSPQLNTHFPINIEIDGSSYNLSRTTTRYRSVTIPTNDRVSASDLTKKIQIYFAPLESLTFTASGFGDFSSSFPQASDGGTYSIDFGRISNTYSFTYTGGKTPASLIVGGAKYAFTASGNTYNALVTNINDQVSSFNLTKYMNVEFSDGTYLFDTRTPAFQIATGGTPEMKAQKVLTKAGVIDWLDISSSASDTAAQIVTKLESLSGGDRLEASAIQNLPSGAETAEQIKDKLETLSGPDRLAGSAVKDAQFISIENTPTDLTPYANGQVLRINNPDPGRWVEVEGADAGELHSFQITFGADANNPAARTLNSTFNYGYSSFGDVFGSLSTAEGGKPLPPDKTPVMRIELEETITTAAATGVLEESDQDLTILIRKTDLPTAPDDIYVRFYSGVPASDNQVTTIRMSKGADNPAHAYHTYIDHTTASVDIDAEDRSDIRYVNFFTSSPPTGDQNSNPLELHATKELTEIDPIGAQFNVPEADTTKRFKFSVEEQDPDTISIGTPIARDASKDIRLYGGVFTAMATDGTTIWVVDTIESVNSGYARAYTLSTRTRDTSKDINLGAANWYGAVFVNGTIWFVSDENDISFARAYTASTRERDPSKDINLGSRGGNSSGVTDGTTVWFVDSQLDQAATDTARAYVASTRARDSSKDINLGTGGRPHSATSDGTTLWFVDNVTNVARAYVASTRARDSSKDISLGAGNWAGATSDGTTLWFVDDTANINAARAYTASTRTRDTSKDIAFVPGGWAGGVSDGETYWFVEYSVNYAFAINSITRERDGTKDINLGTGSWSSGLIYEGTMWFVDDTSNYARAYTASTRERDSTKDINLGTGSWLGGASDGETFWFVNDTTNIATAYVASTRARDTSKDINLGTGSWNGGESDGTTLWFIDNSRPEFARAYTASTRTRDTSKDISLGDGNWYGSAILEGTTIWFTDVTTKYARAYTGQAITQAGSTSVKIIDKPNITSFIRSVQLHQQPPLDEFRAVTTRPTDLSGYASGAGIYVEDERAWYRVDGMVVPAVKNVKIRARTFTNDEGSGNEAFMFIEIARIIDSSFRSDISNYGSITTLADVALTFSNSNLLTLGAGRSGGNVVLFVKRPEGDSNANIYLNYRRAGTSNSFTSLRLTKAAINSIDPLITSANRTSALRLYNIYYSFSSGVATALLNVLSSTQDTEVFLSTVATSPTEAQKLDIVAGSSTKSLVKIDGVSSKTPRRVTSLPAESSSEEGERVWVESDYSSASGVNITPQRFAGTELDPATDSDAAAGIGSRGWYAKADAGFTFGEIHPPLPDDFVLISDQRVYVKRNTQTNLAKLYLGSTEYTLTRTAQAAGSKLNSNPAYANTLPDVDYYTIGGSGLPDGDWDDLRFETSTVGTFIPASPTVTKGLYEFKNNDWSRAGFYAPPLDPSKPFKIAVEEDRPGTRADKNLPFVASGNTFTNTNPFPGVLRLTYNNGSSDTGTYRRWTVFVPIEGGQPVKTPSRLKIGTIYYSFSYYQTSSGSIAVYRTPVVGTAQRIAAARTVNAMNVQWDDGEYAGQTGETTVLKTINKEVLESLSNALKGVHVPPFNPRLGQRIEMLNDYSVAGGAVLTAAQGTGGPFVGYAKASIVTAGAYGTLVPDNENFVGLQSFANQATAGNEANTTSFTPKTGYTANLVSINGIQYTLRAVVNRQYYPLNGLDGSFLRAGQKYLVNVRNTSNQWMYPNVTLEQGRVYSWDGIQWVEEKQGLEQSEVDARIDAKVYAGAIQTPTNTSVIPANRVVREITQAAYDSLQTKEAILYGIPSVSE